MVELGWGYQDAGTNTETDRRVACRSYREQHRETGIYNHRHRDKTQRHTICQYSDYRDQCTAEV
jgi:hypothetical protein